MSDDKEDQKRAKIFKGPKLPNPVIKQDILKQFWDNQIKLTNKTVKVGK